MLLVMSETHAIPIVSLGRDCTSAYLIRMLHVHEHYQYDNADHAIQVCKQNNLGFGSNLFDWIFINDHQNFIRTLANIRSTDFFDPSRLLVVTPEKPATIVDPKTGIGWHHLFKRSPADQTILTSQIESQVADVDEKINYLRNKFINSAGLFCVYLYFDYWSLEKAKDLCSAIRIHRLDENFGFIYISNNSDTEGLWFFNKETIVLNLPFDYHISEASSNAPGSRTDILLRKLAHAYKLVGKSEAD